MPKVNPFTLRPVENRTETKTFTDPYNPDEELTLTLRAGYDLGRELEITERATDFYARFVLGREEEGTTERVTEALLPVPVPGGGTVTPTVSSWRACNEYARLLVQQVADEEERYNFQELAGLSVTMPDALSDAILWAKSLAKNRSPEQSLKNSSGATTGNTSDSPSTAGPPTTPN